MTRVEVPYQIRSLYDQTSAIAIGSSYLKQFEPEEHIHYWGRELAYGHADAMLHKVLQGEMTLEDTIHAIEVYAQECEEKLRQKRSEEYSKICMVVTKAIRSHIIPAITKVNSEVRGYQFSRPVDLAPLYAHNACMSHCGLYTEGNLRIQRIIMADDKAVLQCDVCHKMF